MSDDEDDDLFADSGGDTDDLIAESKKDSKPIAKPKKLKKKGAAAVAKKRKRDIPGTHERAWVVESKSVFVCVRSPILI